MYVRKAILVWLIRMVTAVLNLIISVARILAWNLSFMGIILFSLAI